MTHFIDSFPSRTIDIDSITYTYFGGTAYLGLQDFKPYQNIFIENLKRYGTNYGASRKSNVRFTVFEKAELVLANLVGSEACLTMSSGYLAGQFLAQFLEHKKHKLFYAPNTHSALFTKKAKNYDRYTNLYEGITKHLASKNSSIPVLFLDSIDFSGINYPQFTLLKSLPLSEIILVVDDSHGIGVVGENGIGVFKDLQKLGAKQLFMCCSLGKGFGIQAGAVFGTKKHITVMENSTFFGGASPASPAGVATFIDAQGIYQKRRTLLEENLRLFLQETKKLKVFTYMKGHPTFSYQNQKLTDTLFQHKIIVTHFNYPNQNANIMSRIVISAVHTKKDILKLTKVLNENI
ncbi:aminotransferase class I/II-fold pyridoxal phosphate-dependent enzyme [Maribacter antarcticus]|uniref:aminotransferase class I/II-fold pyridoxal phosphate-dependent enzyme n=1 Tax=Maribacter antarcticus TaxID=505250 RepID=UPI00047E8FC1|nr:aminotransferase class I/II-fold pyridoxal phosphate-dependent enzyme [Maribacter antarcticus]